MDVIDFGGLGGNGDFGESTKKMWWRNTKKTHGEFSQLFWLRLRLMMGPMRRP